MYLASSGRTGLDTTTPLSKLHIVGHVSESHSGSLFRVEGSSGSLFEVIDSLEGSLLSVNDISGLPILEVFSDDRVVMGSFNQNTLVVTGSKVGIGTATPSEKLDVSGSIKITETTAQLLLPLLDSVATPALAFGDGDSGFYETSDDVVRVSMGGSQIAFWNTTSFSMQNSAGSAMLNEAASTTNPTLVPNRADATSGVGSAGANNLSLIAGGVQVFSMNNAGTTTLVQTAAQLKLPLSNDATTPTLAFGDGDTGFYERSDDELIQANAGTGYGRFRSTGMDALNTSNG